MSSSTEVRNTVVVIAPHPDDETLGCGGTLLKHKASGDQIHWVVVTHMSEKNGYSRDAVSAREDTIRRVSDCYSFESVHNFEMAPAGLDQVAITELVRRISEVFAALGPEIVYIPYRGDIHTDHAITFDAAASCTKWFRYPSVRKVLAYETLSETDFAIDPDVGGFRPNVFVDISAHLDEKIAIANLYASEMAAFPFPRSETALRALAQVRGCASGFYAAEGFMLLRELLG